ncbi:MAG: hypothetical protein CM1200mP2_43510 [Planctomycetaceae bacterium]|nr:MAG: hypothetical protein CM1200mP2_43510 [Planctomycetaceae bacterium]
MTGLFEQAETANLDRARPLALACGRGTGRVRRQQHFLGPGQLLRRILDADRLSSAIFYGPPGTGKTSLAELIAGQTEWFSNVSTPPPPGSRNSESCSSRLGTAWRPGTTDLLFVDELHHFNRTQQDVLLPDVERGWSG